MSFLIGFIAVNMELSVAPGKFQVLSNLVSPFVSFSKIDWHASGFGLLCAWREVLVLRQQIGFGHANNLE
jgi:hypothetical protein